MITIEERQTKKLPGLTSLFVSFTYNQLIVDTLKTFGVYQYLPKDKEWEFPLSALSQLLDNLCSIDDITLNLLSQKSQTFTNYKLSKMKTKLFDYQEDGVQFGLNHNSWLLLDAPGLGKTLQLICLANELKKREKIKHCLVICGVSSLKNNWKKEIEKHSDLSATILGEYTNSKGKQLVGSIQDRINCLKKPIKEFFIITNIESIRSKELVEQLIKGKNQIDMIIVDEVHQAKNPSSQQGKNLLKLNKAKYKIAVTGTLLVNRPVDAYLPLKWIGVDKSCYSTYKYYYTIMAGPFHNEFLGYRNLDTLKEQLDKYSLRRTKDLLNLPEKTIINEYVDMDGQQEKFYTNIKQGIIDQVDKVVLNTQSIIGMVSRLRQATAYPKILTTENIPSAKIDRACDLAEQIIDNGDKVVIFSTFKDTLNELYNRLKEYNPTINTGDTKDNDIAKNIDNFQNNPNDKIFLATWQRCGTGITLTAASYMIFIDTPWTFAIFEQSCDRIYRIGTKKPVTIYTLITKDTVDEKVQMLVDSKEALSEYVIDNKVSSRTIDILKKIILELK